MEAETNISQDIIALGEGQLVEFKEMSGGINPKSLAQTMAAFANADGGDIYLGLSDAGNVRGVRADTAGLDHILNAARELCSPSIEITLQTIPVTARNI